MRFPDVPFGSQICVLGCAILCIEHAYPASALAIPHVDHVVVVIMENHSFSEILNNPQAGFINSIAKGGATFSNSYAVAHPSQPNYLALFSGSTQGVSDNGRHSFVAPNLATALKEKDKAFIGYPETGSPRKHNPWESFTASTALWTNFSNFPKSFEKLPDVGFVIPNLDHDMHDGSIRDADDWLKKELGAYIEYCSTHPSLFIMTFDEDDANHRNHILTIIYVSPVKASIYQHNISHYYILRTIEAIENITPLGESVKVDPISDIWISPIPAQ